MGRSSREEALKNREKILLKALDLFASKGFENVSFAEIGKALNLSKGAVYWHFKDKQTLLIELVRRALLKLREEVKVEASEIDSFNKLEEYYVSLVKAIIGDDFLRKFLKVVYRMAWLPGTLANVKQEACKIMLCPEDLTYIVLDRLEKKGEVSLTLSKKNCVHIINCFLDGLLNFYLTHPEDEKNDSILEYLRKGLQTIFSGMQKR